MDTMKPKPLSLGRVKLIRAPFIYENTKQRWLWQSSSGNDYYNLWICRSGHAKFRFDKEVHEIWPWTVLIVPPHTSYLGWNEEIVPDFRNFSAHWIPLDVDGPVFEPSVCRLKEVDTAEALIQSMLRVSAYDDSFGQQQTEWLLLSLLAMTWREIQLPWDSPADAVILSQIGRIRSGDDLFTDVTTLASEANMSRVHYTRRFKRALGVSPNEFLIRQRIERSALLLKQTDWTLQHIAEVIGYEDAHYFSRQFRRIMGVSPGVYRKAI